MNLSAYILSAALLTPITFAFAQKANVTGEIKGLGNSTFTINYQNGDKSVQDTIQVENDKFTWHADFPEPQKVYFMFPTRYVELFLEQGNMQIKGHKDSLANLQLIGSKIQEEANRFQKANKDLEERLSPLFQKWGKGSAEEQLKIEQEYENITTERRARATKYITANPESAYSLSLVADRATMGSYEDVKPAYDLIHPSILNTNQGKQLRDRLAVLKRSELGTQMLDFTQNNEEGKAVHFADFKGHYVLIDFWASWCGPCRAENPNVLKAYNKYKDSNFTVIGISLDDNAEKWKKAIKDDGMPWTQVSSLNGFKDEVSDYYGIRGIPSTLLVDPSGKIIAKDLRGEMLQQKLAEIFDK